MKLQITEKLEAEKHAYGWTLTETYQGCDKKTRAPKTQTREFHYGNLGQCIKKALDIDCGSCSTLKDVILKIEKFSKLTQNLK